jgi:predicted ATP-dependent serine protease
MHSDLIEGAPGTVSQVRASAQELVRFAKEHGTAVVLVGHVTKDGSIAGPRVLEHMVDTVLSFEGERSHQYRILRAMKNRFGGTDEIGVFAMETEGLTEVPNPSALFLTHRGEPVSGTSVFPAIEGSRPVLVEIQALTVRLASGATPRRAAVGWDSGRLAMILAELRDRGGLSQRRRRLPSDRSRRGPRGRGRFGVGDVGTCGAERMRRARRNRVVRRNPPGGPCRATSQRIRQARLRNGLGAKRRQGR